MVNVGVSLPSQTVARRIGKDVLMYFFLQIDPDRPIHTHDLVGTNTSVLRNVTTRVRDSDVSGIVPDYMRCAFHSSGGQSLSQ